MESSLHASHWLRHLPRLPLIQPGCRAKPFSPCFRILLSSKRSLTSYLSAYESYLLQEPSTLSSLGQQALPELCIVLEILSNLG